MVLLAYRSSFSEMLIWIAGLSVSLLSNGSFSCMGVLSMPDAYILHAFI